MNKHQTLKTYFGYDSFREGQETLIDNILHNQDTLGIMPTGAGKSICYQVPALMLPGITLVISPLISLMKDQVQSLNQAGIHAAYINSSLTESQISKALQLAANGRYKIIYVAPERLETYAFMEFARNTEISMVTVDEAHCISQWGQDFRPSYLKIIQFVKSLPNRPLISAFTATATEAVKEDIICVLGLENPYVLVTGFDRKNLYFGVEQPKSKDKFLLQYVKDHEQESGIIYCATRKNVDTICEKLEAEGVPITKYHAGLSDRERRENQDDFIYDQKPIIVATNAFGMGIDKSNVRYVIHYNMPQSLENYYQEAGRAGRDGEAGECILLYSPQDVIINRFLLDSKENQREFLQEEFTEIRERDEIRLKQMNYYCLTPNCHREYILRYFGEKNLQRCENCSNCQKEFEVLDITKEGISIISCILEYRQRYGINVIAGTLCGKNTQKLKEYGTDQGKSFGSLKELGEIRVKQIINQMLIESILLLTNDKYAILKTTESAYEVLKGNRQLLLKVTKEQEQENKEKEAREREGTTPIHKRKSEVLNSKGLDLFQKLREIRGNTAKEEGMPPYIIFSDKTLVDMCIKLPMNKEEMLTVSGVGENKFEKYGERFLLGILEFTDGKKEKYYFGEKEEQERYTHKVSKKKKSITKKDFSLTKDMEDKIQYGDRELISYLINQLNELRDEETMKKIAGVELIRWLTDEGYLGEQYEDGRRKKFVTSKGAVAGIEIGIRISAKGTEYEDFYFKEEAQRMLVDRLKQRNL